MKKKIECPHCESTFTLVFRDEEVDGLPTHCPFCGDSLDDDHLDFEDQDPIDIPDEDE